MAVGGRSRRVDQDAWVGGESAAAPPAANLVSLLIVAMCSGCCAGAAALDLEHAAPRDAMCASVHW